MIVSLIRTAMAANRASRIHAAHTEAVARRTAADRDLQRAVLSGNTQRIHAARKAMQDATSALMRIENGGR